jgi:hypothetical protein
VEKEAGPGVDEVVDLRLVRVIKVGVVVLIGEGFLKDLTVNLGLLRIGADDLEVENEIFRFLLVLRIGDKAAYFLDFSPIICSTEACPVRRRGFGTGIHPLLIS